MIQLSRKAEIAFHTLQPPDMKRVRKSMEMLDMYPPEYLLSDKVRKLPDTDDIFITEAEPDTDIRIIFRMTDAEKDKEIMDIVRYERLRKMFGSYCGAKNERIRC